MEELFTYDEALNLARQTSDESVTIVLEALTAIVREASARGIDVSGAEFPEMIGRVREIYGQGVDVKGLFDRLVACSRGNGAAS